MGGDTVDGDVELAHRLADVATQVALDHFEQRPERWHKADGTRVSAADLAVERALLELLALHRPDDAVLSEEAGALGAGRRRWLLDPIDGTEGFLAGGPVWGNHIALEVDGRLTVGIVTRPTQGRRWWAVDGQGAYHSNDTDPLSRGHRLAVSRTDTLADARVSGLLWPGSPVTDQLAGQVDWVEVDDPLCIVDELGEARLDAFITEAGAVWDLAPQALVVTEAGGRFHDPHGGTSLDLGGGIYSNGHIDEPLREALAEAWPAH